MSQLTNARLLHTARCTLTLLMVVTCIVCVPPSWATTAAADLEEIPDPVLSQWQVMPPSETRSYRSRPGAAGLLDHTTVVAVSKTDGVYRACALRERDGRIICWGQGLLHESTSTRLPTPTWRVASLAAGLDVGSQMCAIKADTLEAACVDTSSAVSSLPDRFAGQAVLRLACAKQMCCAILLSGALSCWGDAVSNGNDPIVTPPDGRFVDVGVSEDFVAAIDEDGQLHLVLAQEFEMPTPWSDAPDEAVPLQRVVTATYGRQFCAVTNLGTAFCTGEGVQPQWAAVDNQSVPVLDIVVAGFDAATETLEACAVLAGDGSVHCWLLNTNVHPIGMKGPLQGGQPPGSFVAIGAGAGAACAVTSQLFVHCFGEGMADEWANAGILRPPVLPPSYSFSIRVGDNIWTGPRPAHDNPRLALQKRVDEFRGDYFEGMAGTVMLASTAPNGTVCVTFGNRPLETQFEGEDHMQPAAVVGNAATGEFMTQYDDDQVYQLAVGFGAWHLVRDLSLEMVPLESWGPEQDLSDPSTELFTTPAANPVVATAAGMAGVIHCSGSPRADDPEFWSEPGTDPSPDWFESGGLYEIIPSQFGLSYFNGYDICTGGDSPDYSVVVFGVGVVSADGKHSGCADVPPSEAMSDVARLSCGTGYCCALNTPYASADTLRCWGNVVPGKVGAAPSPLEQGVQHSSGSFESLSAGDETVCVIAAGRSVVRCWGDAADPYGLLSGAPNATRWGGQFSDIAVGRRSACVIDSGRLRCWGAGFFDRSDVASPFSFSSRQVFIVDSDHTNATDDPSGCFAYTKDPCVVTSLAVANAGISAPFGTIVLVDNTTMIRHPLEFAYPMTQIVALSPGDAEIVCDLELTNSSAPCMVFAEGGATLSGLTFRDTDWDTFNVPLSSAAESSLLLFNGAGNFLEDVKFRNVTGFSSLVWSGSDLAFSLRDVVIERCAPSANFMWLQGSASAAPIALDAGEALSHVSLVDVAVVDCVLPEQVGIVVQNVHRIVVSGVSITRSKLHDLLRLKGKGGFATVDISNLTLANSMVRASMISLISAASVTLSGLSVSHVHGPLVVFELAAINTLVLSSAAIEDYKVGNGSAAIVILGSSSTAVIRDTIATNCSAESPFLQATFIGSVLLQGVAVHGWLPLGPDAAFTRAVGVVQVTFKEVNASGFSAASSFSAMLLQTIVTTDVSIDRLRILDWSTAATNDGLLSVSGLSSSRQVSQTSLSVANVNISGMCGPLVVATEVESVSVSTVHATHVASCTTDLTAVVVVSDASGAEVLGNRPTVVVAVSEVVLSLSSAGVVSMLRTQPSLLPAATLRLTGVTAAGVAHQVAVPPAVLSQGIEFVTVERLNVSGWAAQSLGGGGAHISGAGDILIEETLLTDCQSGADGGGAYLSATCSVTLRDSFIRGCSAAGGGGGLALTLEKNSECADSVAFRGGEYTALIHACEVRDNRASGGGELQIGGGGVLFRGLSNSVSQWATFSIDSSVVAGNDAVNPRGSGGGVAAATVGIVSHVVSGTTVANNTAGLHGGGITAFLWTDPDRRYGSGGDVNVLLSAQPLVVVSWDSVFQKNVARTGDGGALQVASGIASLSRLTFSDNEASDGSGGALAVSHTSSRIVDTTFVNNSAGGSGGAIDARECGPARAELTRCSFSENTAGSTGGALLVDYCPMVWEDTLFERNSASTGNGGSMSCFDSEISSLLELHVLSSEATSRNAGGGGMYLHSCKVDGEAGEISGCVSGTGGGVLLEAASSLSFESLTVTDSTAQAEEEAGGGGIACFDSTLSTDREIALQNNHAWMPGSAVWLESCAISDQQRLSLAESGNKVDGPAGVANVDAYAAIADTGTQLVALIEEGSLAEVVTAQDGDRGLAATFATHLVVTRSESTLLSGEEPPLGVMTVELRDYFDRVVAFDNFTTCQARIEELACDAASGVWVPPQRPNLYTAQEGIVTVAPFAIAVPPPATLCVYLTCGDPPLLPASVTVGVDPIVVSWVQTSLPPMLPSSSRRQILYDAGVAVHRRGALVDNTLACTISIAPENDATCEMVGLASARTREGVATIPFGLHGPLGGSCLLSAACSTASGETVATVELRLVTLYNLTATWVHAPQSILPSGSEGSLVPFNPVPEVQILRRLNASDNTSLEVLTHWDAGGEDLLCTLSTRSSNQEFDSAIRGLAAQRVDPAVGVATWPNVGIVAPLGSNVVVSGVCAWYSGVDLVLPDVVVRLDNLTLSLNLSSTLHRGVVLPSTLGEPLSTGFSAATLSLYVSHGDVGEETRPFDGDLQPVCTFSIVAPCIGLAGSTALLQDGTGIIDFAVSAPLSSQCLASARCLWINGDEVASHNEAFKLATIFASWSHDMVGSTLFSDAAAEVRPTPTLMFTYGSRDSEDAVPLRLPVSCSMEALATVGGQVPRLGGTTSAETVVGSSVLEFAGLSVTAERGENVTLRAKCTWINGDDVPVQDLHVAIFDYTVVVSEPASVLLPSLPASPIVVDVDLSVWREHALSGTTSVGSLQLECEVRMVGSACGMIPTPRSRRVVTGGTAVLGFAVSAEFAAVCRLQAACELPSGDQITSEERIVDVAALSLRWESDPNVNALPSGTTVVKPVQPAPTLTLVLHTGTDAAVPLTGFGAVLCRADVPLHFISVASVRGTSLTEVDAGTGQLSFPYLGIAAPVGSDVPLDIICEWPSGSVYALSPLEVHVVNVVVDVVGPIPAIALPTPPAADLWWTPPPQARLRLLDDTDALEPAICRAVVVDGGRSLRLTGALAVSSPTNVATWHELSMSGEFDDVLTMRFSCTLESGEVVESPVQQVRTPTLGLSWFPGHFPPTGVTDRSPMDTLRTIIVDIGETGGSTIDFSAFSCGFSAEDVRTRAPLQLAGGQAQVAVAADGTAAWSGLAVSTAGVVVVNMTIACAAYESIVLDSQLSFSAVVQDLYTSIDFVSSQRLLPGDSEYPNVDLLEATIRNQDRTVFSRADINPNDPEKLPACHLSIDAVELPPEHSSAVVQIASVKSTNVVVDGRARFTNVVLTAPPGAVVLLKVDCLTATGVAAHGGNVTVEIQSVGMEWAQQPQFYVLEDTPLVPLPRVAAVLDDSHPYPSGAAPIVCIVRTTGGSVTGQTRTTLSPSQAEFDVQFRRPAQSTGQSDEVTMRVLCSVAGYELNTLVAPVVVDRLFLEWENEESFQRRVLPSTGTDQFYMDPPPALTLRNHTGMPVPLDVVQGTRCTVSAINATLSFGVGGRTVESADETGVASFSQLALNGDFGRALVIAVTCERSQGERVGRLSGFSTLDNSIAGLELPLWLKAASVEFIADSHALPSTMQSRESIQVSLRLYDSGTSATIAEDSFTFCSAAVGSIVLPDGSNKVDPLEFASLDRARRRAQRGIVDFPDLKLTARLGSQVKLVFTCSLGSLPLLNNVSLSVRISPCPAGQQPALHSDACDPCAPGRYSDGGLGMCVECPAVGVRCRRGSLFIQPSYWVPPDVAGRIDETTQLYRCYNDESCVTNQTSRTVSCSLGYKGVLCGVCEAGYALQARRCAECWPNAVSWVVVFCVFVSVIGLVVYWTLIRPVRLERQLKKLQQSAGYQLSPTARMSHTESGDVLDAADVIGRTRAKVAVRITLNYLQLLATLGRFRAHGTRAFHQIFDTGTAVASSPLELGSFKCTIALSFYESWTLGMLLPVIAAMLSIFIGLISVIRQQWKQPPGERSIRAAMAVWLTKRRYLGPVMLVMFFSYGALNTGVVTMLGCTPPINGVQYHRDALDVPCYDGAHWVGIIFAVAATAVYSIGFPVGFVYYLRNRRHKLKDRNFQVNFGFLYAGYSLKRGLYWAEAMVSQAPATALFSHLLLTQFLVADD